ncbi:MAG: ribulose-phosphate 3-epimerase [Anaerovorax sp.]
MARLAPSILSADFSKLGQDISTIWKAGAQVIHVDVMDGHFVPNISYGATVMKSLVGKTNLPFDVHLMIENPERYVAEFVTENTEFITVHAEACTHLHRVIQQIKGLGVKCGVALNPATPLCHLEYVLKDIDLVLVMSVNPGFGGQKFIESALDKVKELNEMKVKNKLQFEIEIDGGITLENVQAVAEAGTDIIVAGSAVFGAPNVEKRVKEFLKKIS